MNFFWFLEQSDYFLNFINCLTSRWSVFFEAWIKCLNIKQKGYFILENELLLDMGLDFGQGTEKVWMFWWREISTSDNNLILAIQHLISYFSARDILAHMHHADKHEMPN